MNVNQPLGQTLFEIRRRYLGDPISRLFPAGYVSPANQGQVIYPRGTAAGIAGTGGSVADKDSAIPASGKNFIGFLTRDCVDQGPTLYEIDIPTNPLGLPFTAGLECSFEKADEVECEGVQYICQSGVGAISSTTAIGTQLSFDGQGRFYVAQSGDNLYFELTGNSGLPGNQPVPNVSTNLRIIAEVLAR